MAKHRDERPLVWTGLRGKDNVVVLTDQAVYVTRLSLQDLKRVNEAFDQGQQPEDVLMQCRRVRLERVVAYEYQHSTLHPLAALTLIHGQPDATKRTVLSFPAQVDRDKFKVELQARLSLDPWKPTETLQHPAVAALKYLGIVGGLALVTILLAVAEWKGDDRWFVAILISMAGTAACVVAAGMGHREVRHPLMTITHEPEASAEDDLRAELETEADADNE
jgi:hypothetical protein